MIDINTALQNILKAVYGRDVRQSIHDAISQINDNALESLDLAKWNFGTDVTEPTSPVEGYTEGAIYFNTTTGIIWQLGGGAWQQLGNMKTINGIEKTGTSGNVDTYTINFNDGTSTTYTVTNGLQGVSVTNITKTGTTGNVDNYAVNLSNGQTTPNGFSVSNGISISNVELDSEVGTAKNYKVKLSDGSYTPNGFTVNNGVSSYVHVRYSSNFDGSGMVTVPTDQTVYIGICVTTQSNAPTDPAVYNWVRFIGQSGSGSGDMLKSEYATKYAGTVDKAAALYDGTNEISANQLMTKSEYDTNGLTGTVDKATKLVDIVNSVEADTEVLAKFAENEGQLQYNGEAITAVDGDTITRNDANELTLASDVTTKLQKIEDDFVGKLIGNASVKNIGYELVDKEGNFTLADLMAMVETDPRSICYLNYSNATLRNKLVSLGLIDTSGTGFGILSSSTPTAGYLIWISLTGNIEVSTFTDTKVNTHINLTNELQKVTDTIKTKNVTHSYSIAANGSTWWNARNDTNFSLSGYTPIGVVSYQTNSSSVIPVNISISNSSYGMFLKNISNSTVELDFNYTVIYQKN